MERYQDRKGMGTTMKKTLLLGCCLLFTLALAGCKSGPDMLKVDEITENTIQLDKDGSVCSVQLEAFEKNYYEETELRTFMENTIKKYNNSLGKDAVKLDSVSVRESKAKAVYTFSGLDEYAAFNKVDAALITPESAKLMEGLPEQFQDSKGETVSSDTALGDGKYMVLVVKQPLQIQVGGDIAYYYNASLLGRNLAKAGDGSGTILVFKK